MFAGFLTVAFIDFAQGGLHDAFWQSLVSEGISLIDNLESADGVTPEEKVCFWPFLVLGLKGIIGLVYVIW